MPQSREPRRLGLACKPREPRGVLGGGGGGGGGVACCAGLILLAAAASAAAAAGPAAGAGRPGPAESIIPPTSLFKEFLAQ